MAKSQNQIDGEKASLKSIMLMKAYVDQAAPTEAELQAVEAQLIIANGKYIAADANTPGEIGVDEFFKVIQNIASTQLQLAEVNPATKVAKLNEVVAIIDQALAVPSLAAAKTPDLNGYKLIAIFNKAQHFMIEFDGDKTLANLEAVIAAAEEGLVVNNADADLTAIRQYATAAVVPTLTSLAIAEIVGGTSFTDFINGKPIGANLDDLITVSDLADSIASKARFEYNLALADPLDPAITHDKATCCVLINSVIGERAEANGTLSAMISTSEQVVALLVDDIDAAVAPLGEDFSVFTWA